MAVRHIVLPGAFICAVKLLTQGWYRELIWPGSVLWLLQKT